MAALVNYRLRQADESLQEAEVLLKNGMSLRGAVNRIYYGLFYSALALLTTRKIGSSKHTGVLALFNKEFIKTGIFPVEMGKNIWKAFNMRQRGDYKEFEILKETDVKNILVEADFFVKNIRKYIKSGKLVKKKAEKK